MSLVEDYLLNTLFYIAPEEVKTDLIIFLFVGGIKETALRVALSPLYHGGMQQLYFPFSPFFNQHHALQPLHITLFPIPDIIRPVVITDPGRLSFYPGIRKLNGIDPVKIGNGLTEIDLLLQRIQVPDNPVF